MNVLMTILGVLVLLPSAAAVIFGAYMAFDPKTRGAGVLFGLWWVSAVAAAIGILIRDPATFLMGLVCFVVAGLALVLEERMPQKPPVRPKAPSADSEKTTQENKVRERSEDAS